MEFSVNWVSVPIFLALATVISLHARRVSGGWRQPWIGTKPVWWFVLIFLLPWVGLPLLIANLILHRGTPGAISGRQASPSAPAGAPRGQAAGRP